MTPEIFKARLLQIELERNSLLLHERIMDKYNALDPNHERYAVHHYEQVKDDLRALGRGIDNLINEYQAGEKPADGLSMSEEDILDSFFAYTCQAKFINGNQQEATVVAMSDIAKIIKEVYSKLEGTGK